MKINQSELFLFTEKIGLLSILISVKFKGSIVTKYLVLLQLRWPSG